ncbi:uncharacterized protein LOC111907463 [Lactuca sativa]|uniref:uncharacterized protein LOC111907463 n=1 Tax=Lactuca sativa TaxID=4236 RepID=UPI000CD8806E|nr:uncharacterized protein LOC111907463 [Lactuca sativa]
MSLRRNREAGHDRLIEDYFADDAIYAVKFRRRFRMRNELFLRTVGDLEDRFPYFQWKMDARRIKGFSPIKKCIAAIRQLAYGMGADKCDEYFRMSERTVRKHGLSGMLGSIDCMHWSWSLCPDTWRGQYMRGVHKEPTIIVEAIASHDLWIWHAFFGQAGANNDINVLDQSPVFNDIYLGKSHDPSIKYCDDDLFGESDDDSDMFVENKDSDDENDVQENDEDDEVDNEDDDSKCRIFF